jgi:hypothetical protein
MKLLHKFCLGLLLFAVTTSSVAAQMARKPSAMREPPGAMDKRPDSPRNSLPKITSQADFDKIGRTYHQNTPYAMPHAMFVIDRRSKNKVFFVNSQRFRFHKDFLYATGLAPLGSDIYKTAYFNEDRRFIVGTIAWQKTVDKWTWELWEGDLATSEHIMTAHTAINKMFFEPVNYKPNSYRQEDASAKLNIPIVTQNDINKNQEYLALNTGSATGRIHIIDKLDDTVEIGVNEILILKELPESLPPVRGIIIAKPSSPLSHINILAKGWNIPNIYIKDADKLFRELNQRWITLDATLTNYKYRIATNDDHDKARTPLEREAPANLDVKKVTGLRGMRQKDSIAFGAKSANLGEMLNRNVANVVVPDGFTVPFYWYDKFIKENKLEEILDELLEDNDFIHNPRVRRAKLEDFRKRILEGKFDDSLRAEIINKWKTQLAKKPVFVRSSSNAEDLPDFSGAGLYSSAANVTDEESLIKAVKKVWSSLWNFNAYEARVRNFVDHRTVYMSALIQVGVDMDRGGVMITKDPFEEKSNGSVFISAVCGHNSNVVNNVGIPEQILSNPRTKATVLMTFSDQTNSLRFNPTGDLVESPDKCANPRTRRILNNSQVQALAATAASIKRIFGNKREQDIEWGIMNGKIYVVQARPYIDKK